MTDLETWRTSDKTIRKSQRYYAHFDYRTDISKCWEYISVPDNIVKHGFYPFIHYVKKMQRYSSRTRERIDKTRDIFYAAHIDRCIFQFYNFLINERYNDECVRLGIQDVAVAYRSNLKKQNNIDFAKRAIQFIRQSQDAYIMIGDFTHFFDMLDHGYLKRQWCSLFHTDRLSADHYAIFKNITQYSYVELSNLLAFHGLKNTSKGRRELNCKKRVLSPKELKENTSWIQKNKGCGIPQGSPISGALANVYMLEADKEIHTFVSEHEGLYIRYSDDFIIILPHISETDAIDAFKQLRTILAQHPGLDLQPNKTQYYYFHEKQIQKCGEKIDRNASMENHQLNFLGFTFDGRTVRLRAKTVSKFYQRMRRSAKRITKGDGYTKNGNRISGKNLYEKYSVRGANIKKRGEKEEKKPGGNFLTYVYRAQEENRFGPCKDIAVITDRNMAKIRGFLKKG